MSPARTAPCRLHPDPQPRIWIPRTTRSREGGPADRGAGRGRRGRAHPLHGRRHSPDRHRVVDGPDDDRAQGVLPRRPRTPPRRAPRLLRQPVPHRQRSTPHYYALPSRRTAELWVERTPPDFTFDIKAHALMTGQPTETKRLPKDLRDGPARRRSPPSPGSTRKDLPRRPARRGLDVVRATASSRSATPDQLGSILLQYPRWFFTSVREPRRRSRQAIGRLRDAGLIRRRRVPERQLVQRQEHRADAQVQQYN